MPTLEALVASEHEVAAVVTQPDKPLRDGAREIHMSPVKECALKHNIPVYQPVRARDEAFVEEMRTLKPDAMVVIAFGQILPKESVRPAKIRMCEHPRVPASKVPRRSPDPVGCHQRR